MPSRLSAATAWCGLLAAAAAFAPAAPGLRLRLRLRPLQSLPVGPGGLFGNDGEEEEPMVSARERWPPPPSAYVAVCKKAPYELPDRSVELARRVWARLSNARSTGPWVLWENGCLGDDGMCVDAVAVAIVAGSLAEAQELQAADPAAADYADVAWHHWTISPAAELLTDSRRFPYLFLTSDDPDAAPGLRAATRPAHLDYLSKTRKVSMAGPLRDPAGAADAPPTGSLVLASCDDDEAAAAFAADDPYAQAGLFRSTYLKRCSVADVDGDHVAGSGGGDATDDFAGAIVRETLGQEA